MIILIDLAQEKLNKYIGVSKLSCDVIVEQQNIINKYSGEDWCPSNSRIKNNQNVIWWELDDLKQSGLIRNRGSDQI